MCHEGKYKPHVGSACKVAPGNTSTSAEPPPEWIVPCETVLLFTVDFTENVDDGFQLQARQEVNCSLFGDMHWRFGDGPNILDVSAKKQAIFLPKIHALYSIQQCGANACSVNRESLGYGEKSGRTQYLSQALSCEATSLNPMSYRSRFEVFVRDDNAKVLRLLYNRKKKSAYSPVD